MKKLIIIGILLLSCNAWGAGILTGVKENGEAIIKHEKGEEWSDEIDKSNKDEVAILDSGREPIINSTHQLQRCDLVIVRQINRLEKEIRDQADTIAKIYSMLADIHIKEMGLARYNQIYDPTNEGEVAKQKRLMRMK